MSPRERWRFTIPPAELAMLDHAGDLTAQLEHGLAMLAIAVDLLAAVTGKDADEVVAVLDRAAVEVA